MKKSFTFLLRIWILVQSSTLFAQSTAPVINSTLSGKIVDEKTKEPLIGATVQINGTTNGAATDAYGAFTLKTGQTLPFTLVVTYTGYKTREVTAISNTIDIELAENFGQLSEVVVVGYGYYGVQSVIRTIPLLNASKWCQLRKDAAKNSGKTTSLPSVSGYALDTAGVGTDWQAAAFRQAAIQNHNLSVLSGSERTRLAILGNYFQTAHS